MRIGNLSSAITTGDFRSSALRFPTSWRLLVRLAAWHRQRLARQDLAVLSDRMLVDLGLTRQEVADWSMRMPLRDGY